MNHNVENNPVRSIIDSFTHYKDSDPESNVLEISSEAAVALFALYIAKEAGRQKLVTVEALPVHPYASDEDRLMTAQNELDKITTGLPELATSLSKLKSEWEKYYWLLKLEMYNLAMQMVKTVRCIRKHI